MTSFLYYIIYMLALMTAKRMGEVFIEANSNSIMVMDEYSNNETQWIIQMEHKYQQNQQQQQQKDSQFYESEKFKLNTEKEYTKKTNENLKKYKRHDHTNEQSNPLSLQTIEEKNEKVCGGILTQSYGIIQTPNFPNKFYVPITCIWIIDASELASGPNISIVIYLTQLYVLGGLKFTEYMYYSDDYKVPSQRIFEITEDDVTKVTWIQFNSQYLEIKFTMKSLEGTHLRALDRFLDVYGFNITYEIDTVKSYQCNTLQCRFLGHCYAQKDFT